MRLLQRITIALFLLVLLVFGGVTAYDMTMIDRAAPQIRCDSDVIEISVRDPETVLLQGVTAWDDKDGDLTDMVMITNVSQLITEDTAKVSYAVFDAANNMAVYSRKVRYTDYEKPRFQLSQPLVYTLGDTISLLDRLMARDKLDGDISDSICVTAQNISQQTGVYTITVQVTNSLGDTASVPLKVIIRDTAREPMIQLKQYLVYLEAGRKFDAEDYIQQVKNARGIRDSVANVRIEDTVDENTPGSYHVCYTYSDQGQTDSAYLTVVVS